VAADPLDLFFYRPDEEAAVVPALGGGLYEEPGLQPPEILDEYLTFLLGKEEYAVAIERVREVLRAPAITEVPRAPAHVLGVVTVRGEVVAVVDARGRLGLGGGESAAGRIVIVDAGEGPLGLLVDAVTSVVRLPRGSIEPCPQGMSAGAADCVTGIGRHRDQLFMVIDAAALLPRSTRP
jgi:purine-binding chemotaxis protein CheW